MLQLIALLLASWFLLWWFEKDTLRVLGLLPNKQNTVWICIVFIVSALCAASAVALKIGITKEQYAIAESLTAKGVLTEVWHQFRSVFTEELLFRGAIFYILLKKTSAKIAIPVSAVLFALMHWLNAGVWGNMLQMAIVFSFTFAMGILLAYAYAATNSIIFPLAIHFGWNLTQNYIFPDTANGQHIFILSGTPPAVTISYIAFFALLLVPKIAVIVFNFILVKQYRKKHYGGIKG